MTIINPNSISGISSITALNSTAAINLFKADGTSANIIAGVTTGSNFITGTSNVHSTGYECTNINASGIITATNVNVGDDLDVTDDLTIGGEFNMIGSSDSNKYIDARIGSSNTLVFRSASGGGGNLVTINDNDEFNWILDTYSDYETPNTTFNWQKNKVYIGYTDKDSEGNWNWVSGEESTYSPVWAKGMPDNHQGAEDYA